MTLLPNPNFFPPGVIQSFAVTTPDGSFTLAGIPPGSYSLRARELPSSEKSAQGGLSAQFDLTVGDSNINGLSITLQPGATVSGRVVSDVAKENVPPNNRRVVILRPIESGSSADVFMAKTNSSGAFEFLGVLPGRYLTLIDGLQSGQVLASVEVPGKKTADLGIEVGPGDNVGEIRLVVTEGSEVSGTIQDLNGELLTGLTVVVFPTDENLWLAHSGRIATTASNSDGLYRFTGLLSGQYYLAAVARLDEFQWFDTAFLRAMSKEGVVISVPTGQSIFQPLKVRRLP